MKSVTCWRRALFAVAAYCRWPLAWQRAQAHRFARHVGTPRGEALLRTDLIETADPPLSTAGLWALIDDLELRAKRPGGVLLPRREAAFVLRELRAWLAVREALAGAPARRALALLLAFALPAAPARAQRAPYPDWRPLERRADGPVTAPRLVFAYADMTAGVAAYAGTRLVTGLPPRVAAPVAAAVAGVVPHVVGAAVGAYRVDPPDWAADAWVRGGPALVAPRCAAGLRTRRCLTAAGVYLAGAAFAFGFQR